MKHAYLIREFKNNPPGSLLISGILEKYQLTPEEWFEFEEYICVEREWCIGFIWLDNGDARVILFTEDFDYERASTTTET